MWITCFAIVKFDLDYGQVVDSVVPPDALSDADKKQLAHVAFPDSNPDSRHNFVFSFTLQSSSSSSSLSNFYCGMAYYRQKRDPSLQRGYVQQSLVLLSELHYIDAHERIINILAPLFGQACDMSPDPVNSVLSTSFSSFVPSAMRDYSSPSGMLEGAVGAGGGGGASNDDGKTSLSSVSQSDSPIFSDSAASPSSPSGVASKEHTPVAPQSTNTAAQRDEQLRSAFRKDEGEKGSTDNAKKTQVEVLEKAWKEISEWPSPHPHTEYTCELLGSKISFTTPTRTRTGQIFSLRKAQMRLDKRLRLLGSDKAGRHATSALALYSLFRSHLKNLTKIWELLVSHQHLLILSNSPITCSASVLAATSFVLPIPMRGVYRPYYTVQDKDFSEFSSYGRGAVGFPHDRSVVIGCTNPYFVRAFSGWRNVMSVGDPSSRPSGMAESGGGGGIDDSSSSTPSVSASCSPTNNAIANSSAVSTPTSAPSSAVQTRNFSNATGSITPSSSSQSPAGGMLSPSPVKVKPQTTKKGATAWEGLLWGFTEVFASPYPFVLDHTQLTQDMIYRLETVSKSSSLAVEMRHEMCNEIVRKHFASLTHQFLMPLVHCFDSIASRHCSSRAFKLCSKDAVALFQPGEFLEFVGCTDSLPPIFGKKKRKEIVKLYDAFLRGCNFAGWLEEKIDAHVRHELETFSCPHAVYSITEVDLIDMWLGLFAFAQQELYTVGPDLVLITHCTAVLAELAESIREPLKETFVAKLQLLQF